MNTAANLILDSLHTGAIASVATGLTVAALGQAEESNPVAALNAVSHIAWGEKAARQEGVWAQYTLTGALLNSLAVTSWAAVHESLFGKAIDRGDVTTSLLGGAAVSALAYVVDYHVVPGRFTPGFEKRLSNKSLFAIYGVLALSLGLGRLSTSVGPS